MKDLLAVEPASPAWGCCVDRRDSSRNQREYQAARTSRTEERSWFSIVNRSLCFAIGFHSISFLCAFEETDRTVVFDALEGKPTRRVLSCPAAPRLAPTPCCARSVPTCPWYVRVLGSTFLQSSTSKSEQFPFSNLRPRSSVRRSDGRERRNLFEDTRFSLTVHAFSFFRFRRTNIPPSFGLRGRENVRNLICYVPSKNNPACFSDFLPRPTLTRGFSALLRLIFTRIVLLEESGDGDRILFPPKIGFSSNCSAALLLFRPSLCVICFASLCPG